MSSIGRPSGPTGASEFLPRGSREVGELAGVPTAQAARAIAGWQGREPARSHFVVIAARRGFSITWPVTARSLELGRAMRGQPLGGLDYTPGDSCEARGSRLSVAVVERGGESSGPPTA